MVQEKYRPDGWLGFCITNLQYSDFFGRYSFDEAMDILLKSIQRITAVVIALVYLINLLVNYF